jgi:hypothetical protein
VTIYEGSDEILAAVTEALEGAVIQAVATGNPMADRLGQVLFLARRGHDVQHEMGVYMAFIQRFKDHPEVQKIRIAELLDGWPTRPPSE